VGPLPQREPGSSPPHERRLKGSWLSGQRAVQRFIHGGSAAGRCNDWLINFKQPVRAAAHPAAADGSILQDSRSSRRSEQSALVLRIVQPIEDLQ
jgi:hypothetical protein